MREHLPEGSEELDLTTIAGDDQLLDALGRGEPGPAGDDLAAMLATWRTDLDNASEADVIRPAVDVRPATPAAGAAPVGRRILRLAAAVIALVAIATGLGVGSRNAGPTSPLWSLTKVLYPQQAEVRSVEDTIHRARAAIAAGHLDQARDLVEQARSELAAIDDPAVVTRLRAELDALQRALRDATPTPSPDTSFVPTPGSSAGSGPPTPAHSAPPEASPQPEPQQSPGGSLLPRILPLPSLPPLAPTSDPPPLLPSLPGLPLPTGDLLG